MILDEIKTELLSEHPSASISGVRVLEWMKSDEIEVLGATSALLEDPTHRQRIELGIPFHDYQRFYLRFFERCIRENPDGEWSDSRYLAAHGLVAWFNGLWKDPQVPRAALNEIKLLLEKLYREGDEEIRCCIVTGALEHLLVNRQILKFFYNWKSDETLRSAYNEALGYAQELRDKEGGN